MRAIAQVLSYIFHPIFLPTLGLIFVFGLNSYISQTTPFAKQVFIVAWIFVNTALIPLVFTLFLRWRGMVTSIQLHSREDRLIPFTFALLFYFTNYWLMQDIALPMLIHSIFLGSSIAVGMALVFTFFTKISIHMIGMGGITASLFGLSQVYQLPIIWLVIAGILASGAVGSARYILESHNLRQIYLGWITGFCSVYLPLHFGWG
jgi:hypothetical protein